MPDAPGKPKDSAQTRLRAHKRQWNAAYKDVSQKLKAFKNGLNGKGDTKYSLPPSDIKFPLPNEIGSFLDGVAGEFQALLTDAHSIFQEQETYSRTRRKRKPKAPNAPTPSEPSAAPQAASPSPPDQVENTLSRLGAKHNAMLEAYGSNKLTRFWQYLKSPFSRKPFNKQRIGLLSLCSDLYYSLLDFENEILSLKMNSIPKSLSEYQASRSTFDAIKSSIEKLAVAMEKKEQVQNEAAPTAPVAAPSVPAPSPSIKEIAPAPHSSPAPSVRTPETDVKKILDHIHVIYDTQLANRTVMQINSLIQQYKKEPDEHVKAMLKDRINESYLHMMKSITNDIQKKYGPATIRNPQDIINLVEKNRQPHKDASFNEQMIKEAHSGLTRFLKRQLVKARSYDKTAGHRLEIAETIQEIKKLIQKMMNSLESGLDPEALQGFLEALDENMRSINKTLSILITLYEQEFYKNEKVKSHKLRKKDEEEPDLDQFTDYLMRRKVRRDMSKGIM